MAKNLIREWTRGGETFVVRRAARSREVFSGLGEVKAEGKD